MVYGERLIIITILHTGIIYIDTSLVTRTNTRSISTTCIDENMFFQSTKLLDSFFFSMSLSDVKFVDERTKLLIFGCIRWLQKRLPQNSVFFIISKLVIHWCLVYYFERECFDHHCIAAGIKLDTNKIRIDTAPGSSFLCQTLHSGIHKWTFRFYKKSRCKVAIGIWATERGLLRANTTTPLDSRTLRCTAYAYTITNRSTIYKRGTWESSHQYGIECKDKDVIEMLVDFHKLEMQFSVNGRKLGVAHFIQRESYKGVVSANGEGCVIQLLSYQHVYE